MGSAETLIAENCVLARSQPPRRDWTSSAERAQMSHSENLVIVCYDLLPLSVNRCRITFHHLDLGQQRPSCSLLHKCVERAQSGGMDQGLLRIEVEQEALE